MKRILFQGDSITDAGRDRTEEEYHRGFGYATMVAGALGMERPGEFEFINRGISGNRSIDLLARVKVDTINLKPDYISILIGVNDVISEYTPRRNGVDAGRYELYYDMMVKQIVEELPDVKIMILEPFILKGIHTEAKWPECRIEVEARAKAARAVAEKNNLIFIPLMKMFDEAQKLAPASYWLLDGVHPSAMGHEMIKNEWIKAFKKMEVSE